METAVAESEPGPIVTDRSASVCPGPAGRALGAAGGTDLHEESPALPALPGPHPHVGTDPVLVLVRVRTHRLKQHCEGRSMLIIYVTNLVGPAGGSIQSHSMFIYL